MAVTATIKARTNADWSKTFTWKVSAGGAAIPVNDLRMQVRRMSEDKGLYIELTSATGGGIVIDDGPGGKFTITLPRVKLEGMAGDYDFDLLNVAPDGTVTPVMQGVVNVDVGVTII